MITNVMRTVVFAIPVVFVVLVAMLVALQRKLIFPNDFVKTPDEPRAKPDPAEQWWIDTPEGRVEAWYLAGDGRSEESPGPAVIYAHGNGESIDDWPDLMRWYADRGVSALLVEYRGYGRSQGTPSAEKVARDFAAFHQRLVTRPEVDGAELIYHGRSLGGGAVCSLARSEPPAALVLQSTFTSLSDVAWHHYFAPAFLLQDEFDNVGYLSKADHPVLITHGRSDRVIPFEHAERLHAAAARSRFVTYDGGHNNIGHLGWDELETFLDSHHFVD